MKEEPRDFIDEVDELLPGSQPTCPTLEELVWIHKYKIEFGNEPPLGV